MPSHDFLNNQNSWLERRLGNIEKPDITRLNINEIKSCGMFTPKERTAEYRRRGKSPSV